MRHQLESSSSFLPTQHRLDAHVGNVDWVSGKSLPGNDGDRTNLDSFDARVHKSMMAF